MSDIKSVYEAVVYTNTESRKALKRNMEAKNYTSASYYEGKTVALDYVLKLLRPLLPVDKL